MHKINCFQSKAFGVMNSNFVTNLEINISVHDLKIVVTEQGRAQDFSRGGRSLVATLTLRVDPFIFKSGFKFRIWVIVLQCAGSDRIRTIFRIRLKIVQIQIRVKNANFHLYR